MAEENKITEEDTAAATEAATDNTQPEPAAEEQQDTATEEETTQEKTDAEKLAEAEDAVARLKNQLLRQMAEFDNYRKRTVKEKSELILNGGQRVLESLLPVMDDLERAQENMANAKDIDTLKEGVALVMGKLAKALDAHGLKRMETDGAEFDTDFHEAIALTPAQDEAQKNHIIDCVQPGYLLNGKVIRHAKVVVAQ